MHQLNRNIPMFIVVTESNHISAQNAPSDVLESVRNLAKVETEATDNGARCRRSDETMIYITLLKRFGLFSMNGTCQGVKHKKLPLLLCCGRKTFFL